MPRINQAAFEQRESAWSGPDWERYNDNLKLARYLRYTDPVENDDDEDFDDDEE